MSTGTIDLFARMADGGIKACWIIGTNPVASVAGRATVIGGLERAELVVVQDVFADTETTAYADVVLPATLWAESTYTAVNSERNVTLLQQPPTPSASPCPTGASSPTSRAPWGTRRRSRTTTPRTCSPS